MSVVAILSAPWLKTKLGLRSSFRALQAISRQGAGTMMQFDESVQRN